MYLYICQCLYNAYCSCCIFKGAHTIYADYAFVYQLYQMGWKMKIIPL